jgi:26S proteasome regulatory subunit T4
LFIATIMNGQEGDSVPSSESQPLLSAASPPPPEPQKTPAELRREQALHDFKKRLVEHREWEAKLKGLRMGIRELEKTFDKTEDDMKALQSVGQIVGEVLKQLDDEKFIVKASSGPRYVVGCRNKVNKEKLKQGARVGKLIFLKAQLRKQRSI